MSQKVLKAEPSLLCSMRTAKIKSVEVSGQGVSGGQGPERHGKLTIFRPRYSQPGLTDSRKAFLWAPSENKVWPLGGALIDSFPGPPHLRRVGEGGSFLGCRGFESVWNYAHPGA